MGSAVKDRSESSLPFYGTQQRGQEMSPEWVLTGALNQPLRSALASRTVSKFLLFIGGPVYVLAA